MLNGTVGSLYDFSCRHYANKVAIVFEDREIAFRELHESAYRLANSLLGMGIAKGDAVGVIVPNCPEFLMIDYALAKIGAVRIRLASFHEADDIIDMMQQANGRLLIYHELFEARIGTVRQRLSQDVRFCEVGDSRSSGGTDVPLNTLISSANASEPQVQVGAGDLYTYNFTGGTTGRPKGVMRSHSVFTSMLDRILIDCEVGFDETMLAAATMTHFVGALLLPVLVRGGKVVVQSAFDAERFLDAIARRRVTLTSVVPTMIYELLATYHPQRHDISSLRNVVYGAAPTNPVKLAEAVALFGPIFTQAYGETEAPIPLTVLHRHEHVSEDGDVPMERLSSCGRQSVTTELRIVDGNSREVADGKPGEIVVRNGSCMVGYLNNPEGTAEVLRDGWIFTGDIAYKDAEGYLHLVDRKRDIIITGGFNVYPKEVEDVLQQHPAVDAVVVIGVPDEKWGEAVKAVVICRPGATVSNRELISFCKEKKGSVLSPKSVDFVTELPLTGLGKIDRKAVKKMYSAGIKPSDC